MRDGWWTLSILSILLINVLVGIGYVESQVNCSRRGDRVWVTAPVGGTSLQNLSDPRTLSLMAIDPELRLDHFRRTVSCSYHTPIQWIISDPVHTKYSLKWNYFARGGEGPRMFISEFVFVFRLQDLTSALLLTCEPLLLKSPCQRAFVEVRPGKYMPSFNVTSATNIFPAEGERVGQLGNSSWEDCPLRLYVKETEGDKLLYKWEHHGLGDNLIIQKAIPTNSSIHFQNLFRLAPQDRNCVQVLKGDEECFNCKRVSKDSVNSVVFYAKAGDMEIVLKGLFTLPRNRSSRHFRMEWEVGSLEMMELDDLPFRLYVNRTYEITCVVSTFYFALGTKLRAQHGHTLLLPNQGTEVYTEFGGIKARRNFTFTKGGFNERINCFAPLIKSSHWLYKSRSVYIDYPEPPRIVNASGNIMMTEEKPGKVNVSIFCEGFGKPRPTLTWHFPLPRLEPLVSRVDIETEEGGSRSELTFRQLRSEFKGTYKCVARNYLTSVSHTLHIQLLQDFQGEVAMSRKVKMWIGFTLAALLTIFLVVIALLVREVRMQKVRYEKETDLVKEEFLTGIRKSGSGGLVDPLQLPILSRPYNKDFEVPLQKWNIEDGVLGEGEFGVVRKGTVEMESGEVVPMAVKMLKPCSDLEDFKAFLLEIKVMEYVGHHPNIICLLACSTQNFHNRDVLIGVEFCQNGSLQKYLYERKGIFQRREDPKDRNSAFGSYANFTHSSLTEMDLYIWAFQIARGMEFLAIRNVLHGDLAARNVLLKADKVAKISDFGLARFLNEHGDYVKKNVRVPWKLMPPESLKYKQFSRASDIWAYGVTLWEIFSLGEIPYAGLGYGPEFLTSLDDGMRLTKPSRAPNNIYGIMLDCWEPDPSLRPHFSQLKTAFSGVLETLNSPSKSSQIFPEDILIPRHVRERTRSGGSVRNSKLESLDIPSTPSNSHYTNSPTATKPGNPYLNC